MPRHRRSRQSGGGGGGAAEFGQMAFGGIGQQQAVPGTNVLLIKPVTGGGLVPLAPASLDAPTMKGGNKRQRQQQRQLQQQQRQLQQQQQQGGDTILADLAVPAVLLVANQAMSRRRRSKGPSSKRRSFRKRRTFRKRR